MGTETYDGMTVKSNRQFIDGGSDRDIAVASWVVSMFEGGTIDATLTLNDGREYFELWGYMSSQSDYDDFLAKLDVIRNMVTEVGRQVVEAKIALGNLEEDRKS